MALVCPECKNDVTLSPYPNLVIGHVVECDTCGISLVIQSMNGADIQAEIVDEGK